MLLLNFSHPITEDQRAQIEALSGKALDKVVEAPAQFKNEMPFTPQVQALVEALNLKPTEWQTLPILVNLPSYNFAAAVLLAELEGRMGYLPTIVRIRPVAGVTPTAFEVAEIINLAKIRTGARETRGPS